MRGLACLFLFILGASSRAAGPDGQCVLVDNSVPRAAIVVADQPVRAVRDAAEALQKNVAAMTGASLPIVSEGQFDGRALPILVGASKLAEKNNIVVKQDRDAGDRYLIRADAAGVALIGNDAGERRNSVYAVYDFLERQGCGWFGPKPAWHVIPKKATLVVDRMIIDERPAFDSRSIWIVKDPVLRDAWRLGGWQVNCGHNLDRVLPRKQYAADHPDWFGKGQPCMTHPDVIATFVRRFSEEIDKQATGIVSLSVSANDNEYFCQCARCRAIGNDSAKMLNFANTIARELAKTHPKRYLITFYAYWACHDAPDPPLRAEPGVCVMQVDEGNHMKPWDVPEPVQYQRLDRNDNNFREVVAFEGWRKTGAILGIREWWIPGCKGKVWREVPWYPGETLLRNFRFWQRNDVCYVNAETGFENKTGFPLRWPLCYVGARGFWHPELSVRRIMADACDKLYGPASVPMRRFYEVLERAMVETPDELRGYAWRLPGPEDIYLPKIEAAATAALDEAGGIAVEPGVRGRLDEERAMWKRARRAIAGERSERIRGATSATKPASRAYNDIGE